MYVCVCVTYVYVYVYVYVYACDNYYSYLIYKTFMIGIQIIPIGMGNAN